MRARPVFPAVSVSHPCLTCGACCAFFRVSFHWSEADPALGGQVPFELTESLRTHAVVFAAEQSRRERRMVEMSEVLKTAQAATA